MDQQSHATAPDPGAFAHIENPVARDAAIAAAAVPGAVQSYGPPGFVPFGHRRTPLTLQEMHAVIDRGHSVLYGGRIIATHHGLPTEAQLAGNDPQKRANAERHLQEQLERINAQLEDLRAGRTPPPGYAPGVGPGTAPVAATQPVAGQPHLGLATQGDAPAPSDPGAVAREVEAKALADAERLKDRQREALLRAGRPAGGEAEGQENRGG